MPSEPGNEPGSWTRMRILGVGGVTVVILTAAVAIPRPAEAQQQQLDPQPHFLQRPELRNSVPYRDLVFEGQILRHITFYSSLVSANGRVMNPPVDGEAPTSTGWGVTFTPLVRLRMLGETSSPVRPPSFMPKFTLQHFRLKRTSDSLDEFEYTREPVDLWSFDLTIGHHSNGQEGCLWDEDLSDGDPACLAPLGVDVTSDDLNQASGSWSTHYLRADVRFKRMPTDDDRVVDGEWGGGLWFEGHPHFSGNPAGSISSELQDLYGWGRVGARFQWMGRGVDTRARNRIELSLEGVIGADSEAPDVNFSLEVSRSYEWLRGWGFFARWYWGQDYYNVQFLEELNELQFGLVFDGDPLSVFSEPATTPNF